MIEREREPVTLTTDGPRLVLMDSRMNRNYDGCTEEYSLSQNLLINGKRKQTLKPNFYLLCLHIHKNIKLQNVTLTSKDLTNTRIKL